MAATNDLDRDLGALTATLGDATRRGIYLFVRESAEPVTAANIAEAFAIHPNVARHHLDKLADDGYLLVTRRRPSGRKGPGAGRPAKCYEATPKEIRLQYPARRLDLLTDLLLEMMVTLDPAERAAAAEEAGRRYGRGLAAEIGLPGAAAMDQAVTAVAAALTEIGFGANADGRRLVYDHCPFGRTAIEHPEVVCSLDQGIVKGLLEALDQDAHPETFPHQQPQEACVTQV